MTLPTKLSASAIGCLFNLNALGKKEHISFDEILKASTFKKSKCKEIILELEQKGFLTRIQTQDELGRFRKAEYTVATTSIPSILDKVQVQEQNNNKLWNQNYH